MRRFILGILRPGTWLPILCLAVAFVLAQMFLEKEQLTIISRGTVIAMASAILMIYVPRLFHALRAEVAPKDQYLLTGILVIWISASAIMVWTIVFLMLDRPASMMDHWFPNLCFLAFASSGFYFIKLPGVSKTGWKYAKIAAVIAIMVVTFLLAINIEQSVPSPVFRRGHSEDGR